MQRKSSNFGGVARESRWKKEFLALELESDFASCQWKPGHTTEGEESHHSPSLSIRLHASMNADETVSWGFLLKDGGIGSTGGRVYDNTWVNQFWKLWFSNLSASSITKNRRCWRVKFGVEARWSISLPGVAIRISSFDDPPNKLRNISSCNS